MNKIIFKIAILSILCFLFTNDSKAQGNLQFNKVKLVSSLDTVPTNKVWKIEGVSYPVATVNSTTYISNIIINGVNNQVRTYYHNSGVFWETNFPFWIPAGTTLAASNNVNYISIIEYNIVP